MDEGFWQDRLWNLCLWEDIRGRDFARQLVKTGSIQCSSSIAGRNGLGGSWTQDLTAQQQAAFQGSSLYILSKGTTMEREIYSSNLKSQLLYFPIQFLCSAAPVLSVSLSPPQVSSRLYLSWFRDFYSCQFNPWCNRRSHKEKDDLSKSKGM